MKTLHAYYEDYLSHRRAMGAALKTLDEHRRMIKILEESRISHIPLEEVRIIDVSSVIELARRHGEYGSQRAVVVLRCVFQFVKESGDKLPFDPRDLKLPKVPELPVESLTLEEIQLIREKLPSDLAGLRMRVLMELCLDTGMRIGEICALKKTDIDWENHEIHIRNGKTDQKEVLTFTDRSGDWVKKYYARRRDDMPWVFISGRGALLEVTSRNYLAKFAKTLGIHKHIHHHIFRKTFVTLLLQNGMDIKSVQNAARHASERTTLRHYAATQKIEVKKQQMEILGRIL